MNPAAKSTNRPLRQQLLPIAEFFQRLGVGQGLHIPDRPAMDDIPHGELGNLAGFGARDIRHPGDNRRHVSWRGAGANPIPDIGDQRLIEGFAVAQADKQDNAHIAVPFLPDRDGFLDGIDLLHLAIDLRRTDADAAGIEGRIGSAIDDDAAMIGDLRPVAMAPDPGEALEIGRLGIVAVEFDHPLVGYTRFLMQPIGILRNDGGHLAVAHQLLHRPVATVGLRAFKTIGIIELAPP